MKRFYSAAEAVPAEDGSGHVIRLDGRLVMTPARAPLIVPGTALGQAIADEWAAQGETIDPASMPMTGLANASIDQVLPAITAFADGIAAYGASDLLCYRAGDPAELVGEQSLLWDPLLGWARARFGIAFAVTTGIMPVDQPPSTVARLAEAVHSLDPWLLAGMSTITGITGTLVGALALVEDAADSDALWAAGQVDEEWQARQWGEDAEAAARRALRHRQFLDAVHYCGLVKAGRGGLRRGS